MDTRLPSSQPSTFFTERQIELKKIKRRKFMRASFTLKGIGRLAPAFALIVALCATTTAQAGPLITCNQAGLGATGAIVGGFTVPPTMITTYDFSTGATVGSFIPTGASPDGNGRGVQVLGNIIYYTELDFTPPSDFGPTDFIRIAPYNGGAGGADTGTLPNPRPTAGIQDLAYFNGVLYILTGYPLDAPEVFGLNPFNGAVVVGPISISAPAATDSDGFNVLPNGNFLINQGDGSTMYDQYNPTTGAVIPSTTITVPGAFQSTGVENNGTSLFFQEQSDATGLVDGFTETTFAGTFIANTLVSPPPNNCEDISLPVSACFGVTGVTPGKPNCHGKCVSFLANADGGIKNASKDLGYKSVDALQDAIDAFCGKK